MLGIALDYAADPPRARRVLADSPAARAGIRPGDTVLAIAATPIKTPRDVATALGAARAGDVVRVRLRRDGAPLDLDVPVAARW
jgi:serine protease Do